MVVSGKEIFKLVDSIGLPLDVIVMELRDSGDAFNIAEFIESASKAGWPRKRVLNMVQGSSNLQDNQEFNTKLDMFLDHYYE